MKRLLSILVCLVAVSSMWAARTIVAGAVVDRAIEVSRDFNSIDISGPVDVEFTQSATDFGVTARCPENLLQFLRVKVSNGSLHVSLQLPKNTQIKLDKKPLKIFVTNSKLHHVQSSGSGDFTIKGDFTATGAGLRMTLKGSSDFKAGKIDAAERRVQFSISGSGDIDIDRLTARSLDVSISGSGDTELGTIACDTVKVNISGSGDVEMGGTAGSVDFSITGSGDIDAGGLKAAEGTVKISGSGDIKCNVDDLSSSVSGSGDIRNRRR